MKGKVIILAAPSGSGKTTIARHLLEHYAELQFSVSATTRPKRGLEKEAHDYYFMSVDEFTGNINQNKFVEWEQVYDSVYYGTLKGEVERIWAMGKHIVFDVDVIGGISLKEYFGEDALSIFVYPPSLEVVEQRLRSRKTESEESLQMRLSKTKVELTYSYRYDTVLVNDILTNTLQESEIIIDRFLSA
jgi:guanylate kinase